jgi:hypothetical protein
MVSPSAAIEIATEIGTVIVIVIATGTATAIAAITMCAWSSRPEAQIVDALTSVMLVQAVSANVAAAPVCQVRAG